jgi:TolA-binding protein
LDYYNKIYYADEAWYNLGRCLFELGQFTEAGNAYKILIKKYKKSKLEKLALVEYAKCYKEKGDFKSAAILFLKVLKKYPISEIVELVDLQMQDILNKFPESKYYLKIKEKYTKLLKKIK